ncbi:response regulator transcription factor [Mucilaginibacter polytrichastri]|uniref:Response regulator mprA n=1 Tax=Mucilaginibacter polytrichastri TaxID=1302689 RepID=A0A1Q5ZW13_9SPHI|nr:response regulator transcription factor [Mucilaginibacter polytrichastri]OKS85936.1 Response regulator mprA [Mucilaginibacter polytrichastri]SFS60404.1 Response regulator receiver domain-containing protein [Mucilaginibacter polytrichastri]
MGLTDSGRTKILVAEDDAYMQLILKKFLSKTYDVEICPTAMDALSYLQNGNIPDLIISDLNTPNLSGLELVAQLHASDFFKSIPVIILSGEDSSDTRIKCLDSGADDFIVKPFNPAEVEARVRAILRRIGKITY